MKKIREINSRFKAKTKQVLGGDKQPTRPSTPIPPSYPLGVASPALEQTLSHSSRELAGPLIPFSPSVPTANQEHTGLATEQVSSHASLVQAGALAASLLGAPVLPPDNSHSQVAELTAPILLSPEPLHTQAPTQPSTQPANSEETVAPNTATISPVSSPAPVRSPGSSGLGASSWIRSEGWANLKGCLDTLNQVTAVSGLGPLKTIIEGLADCIGIYEDAAHGRQAYIEVRAELDDILHELHQYLVLSPTVVANVSDVCGLIQKEIDYVKTQQARPKVRRLAEAEQDENNVLACYSRMGSYLQTLTRKLGVSTLAMVEQNAMDNRLRDLAPARSACYDSGNDLKVKRGPCTKDTRINVLDEMWRWTSSRGSGNIYWMSGMAGTGKTTIAYSLCERLDTGPSRRLGASFFCSRSLPECGKVGKIIPSIAFQLAQRCQPFQYALCEAMKRNPDAPNKTPGVQFQALLVEPLSDPKVRMALPAGTMVVIDALDECEDKTSTRQILDVLLTSSEGLPIKFIVCSRPEAAIRSRMEKNDRRLVLHELDKKEVQSDIKTYLREGLARISPLESDIEKLAERADVLFIYAATVIRYVGYDDFGWNPQARLNAVLDMSEEQDAAQTEEIDQLYGGILEAGISDRRLRPTERNDIKLILHTVVCAKAPLTIRALSGLLKLDVGRVHAALRPLWSVLHVMGPEMTVTTLHASFPDYLTDSERSGNTPWHCDAATHHGFLAQKSFERICNTTPQFNICRLKSSYLYDSEVEDLDARVERYIPLELCYACQYWSAHLDVSESGLSLLEQFLTKHLLLWMEVMNLTKNIAITPDNLTTAKKWAAKHGAPHELTELMQDAWRFAQTVVSSPVSQSTPHIYVSMLPFLSSASPLRKHYVHRMQRMIEADGTALDRRNPLLARWYLADSSCAACSPDGTLVAIALSNNHISIIDTSSGRQVRGLFHKDEDVIYCLAFSPDATRIASGTYRGVIHVWDIGNGQLVVESIEWHRDFITSITFSHDGAYIITGSVHCIIHVWDAYSGQSVFTPLVGHIKRITCVAISPDDTKVVSGHSDGTVCVWDMKSGRLMFDPITGHTDNVGSVAFSPNNSFIVSCSEDKTVRVWDSRTGQSFLPSFSHHHSVYSIAISPDSTCIAAGLLGTIQISEVSSGKAVAELFTDDLSRISRLAYSSDGTRLISCSGIDRVLYLFDAHSAASPANSLLGHTELVRSIDISPDGKRIVSGSEDLTICVWEPITGQLVLGPLTGHTDRVWIVRYSPVGDRFLSCSLDGTLRQWDAQTGDCLEVTNPIVDTSPPRDFNDPPNFDLAVYSPDGSQIATLSSNGGVCLWHSKTGERIQGHMKGEGGGISIQFSNDGAALLTGWRDGAVRIWDVQSGQLVSSTRSQDDLYFHAFAFSPNCLYNVVAGSSFGDATTYRRITQTGECTSWSCKGHASMIISMQFSLDGSRIVSGSIDNTMHIWDAQTGDLVFDPLKGHNGWVRSVAYSPDGTYVASASNEFIRVWDVSTQPDSHLFIEWVLDEDGWVVDTQSRRLIWVPVDLRSSLMWPRNTALMSQDGYVRLSFDGAMIGEDWAECWLNG